MGMSDFLHENGSRTSEFEEETIAVDPTKKVCSEAVQEEAMKFAKQTGLLIFTPKNVIVEYENPRHEREGK